MRPKLVPILPQINSVHRRFILLLSSHPCLGIKTKFCIHLFSLTRTTLPAHLNLLSVIIVIFGEYYLPRLWSPLNNIKQTQSNSSVGSIHKKNTHKAIVLRIVMRVDGKIILILHKGLHVTDPQTSTMCNVRQKSYPSQLTTPAASRLREDTQYIADGRKGMHATPPARACTDELLVQFCGCLLDGRPSWQLFWHHLLRINWTTSSSRCGDAISIRHHHWFKPWFL
jgi:hypothetical protein